MKPLLPLLLLSGGITLAVVRRHDVSDATARVHAEAFPAVGTYQEVWCGGTLVAADRVLTAAHCLDDDANGILDWDPIGREFRLGADGAAPDHVAIITAVEVNPRWAQTGGKRAWDMALFTIDPPITDVAPQPLSAGDPIGQVATVVGYGMKGTGNNPIPPADPDVRRAMDNTVDALDPISGGTGSTGALLIDFDHPAGTASTNTLNSVFGLPSSAIPLPLEGSAGPGDSGGALISDLGFGPSLIGVTSGGGHPSGGLDAGYGAIAEFAPVMRGHNVAWLEGQGLEVNGADCGLRAYGNGISPTNRLALQGVGDTAPGGTVTLESYPHTGNWCMYIMSGAPAQFPRFGGVVLIDPAALIQRTHQPVLGDRSSFQVSLPPDPNLVGTSVYLQVLAPDGPAWALSNGLEWRVCAP